MFMGSQSEFQSGIRHHWIIVILLAILLFIAFPINVAANPSPGPDPGTFILLVILMIIGLNFPFNYMLYLLALRISLPRKARKHKYVNKCKLFMSTATFAVLVGTVFGAFIDLFFVLMVPTTMWSSTIPSGLMLVFLSFLILSLWISKVPLMTGLEVAVFITLANTISWLLILTTELDLVLTFFGVGLVGAIVMRVYFPMWYTDQRNLYHKARMRTRKVWVKKYMIDKYFFDMLLPLVIILGLILIILSGIFLVSFL